MLCCLRKTYLPKFSSSFNLLFPKIFLTIESQTSEQVLMWTIILGTIGFFYNYNLDNLILKYISIEIEIKEQTKIELSNCFRWASIRELLQKSYAIASISLMNWQMIPYFLTSSFSNFLIQLIFHILQKYRRKSKSVDTSFS